MPVKTLEPDGIGNYDAWTLAAGPTKWQAVKLPDDDGTTRLSEATASDRQSFTLDDLPAAATITSVGVFMRSQKTGPAANTANMFTRLGGTDLDYSAHTITTSWANYSNAAVARPGGGAWQPNDFPALGAVQLGIRLTTSAGDSVLMTTLYMDVDYVPPAGAMRWLLQAWLPPLLAGASHGVSFREIARMLRKLKTRPSREEEFRRILEAFQVRPRFVFGGC